MRETPGLGAIERNEALTEDSWRVHATPNRAKDCKGQKSGLKYKVALN